MVGHRLYSGNDVRSFRQLTADQNKIRVQNLPDSVLEYDRQQAEKRQLEDEHRRVVRQEKRRQKKQKT